MPGKKTPRKKQTHCWVTSQDNEDLLLPNWKVEQYNLVAFEAKDVAAIGGFVLDKIPRVVATHVGKLNDDSPLPQRCDSVYLHPDTMQVCSLTISQSVIIQCAAKEKPQAAVCKVWPMSSLDIDVMAAASSVLMNTGADEGDLVSVHAAPKVPKATELLIKPRSSSRYPLDAAFECYFLQKFEGIILCEGNVLVVSFHGEEQLFDVVRVTVSSSREDNSFLVNSVANLSLNGSVAEETPTSPDCSTPSHNRHEAIVTSPSPSNNVLHCSHLPVVGKVNVFTKLHFAEESSDKALDNLPSLSAIGGLKDQVEQLRKLVVSPLTIPELTSAGIEFPRGVILHGLAGVGKTLLARALLGEVSCHRSFLSAADLLVSGEECTAKLKKVISEAQQQAPSLVVVDDIDLLCPQQRETSSSEAERRASAALLNVLDTLPSLPQHVVLLATTNRLESIDSSLRRPGRFDSEVEIPAPTVLDRKEILTIVLQGREHSLTVNEVEQVSRVAHGYVGADLKAVCQEAHRLALWRVSGAVTQESLRGAVGRVSITKDDMMGALHVVRPSAMREVAVEVPKVLWSDIGGEEEIKEKLRDSVDRPLNHPEVYKRLGIKAPRGVLLYGPPGCSKTMIARALATESGLNFISVKGPELFSKWVGDSERAVRQVFSRARRAAPSIVFFDEIDALAVHRKGEGSKVGDRVLAQLLTEMDGVEGLCDVLIVAATNRPDMIDKALLRPGRIDRLIYVPLPSNQTRREIMKLQFRKTPTSEDVEVDELVSRTEGFSGAEVVSLFQEAGLCAMHESMLAERLHMRHFTEALSHLKPRTDSAMLQYYEDYQRQTE